MSILEILDVVLRSCPLPVVNLAEIALPRDGTLVPVPGYCKKVFPLGKCQAHYEATAKQPSSGAVVCPYGFSTYKTSLENIQLAVTSLIPQQGLSSAKSKRLSKEAPESIVSEKAIELAACRLSETVQRIYFLSKESGSSHTEALHEVRRLNQIVKVIMERMFMAIKDRRSISQDDLIRASKASELMSLHMDALDLLANPALMQDSPSRGFVLHQIVKKIFVIYEPRADERKVGFELSGNSFATIKADDRAFYIIPSVLIDNAIKYAPSGTKVDVRIFEGAMNNLPSVGFEVISCGPQSTAAEESRLFKQRGRGKMASAVAGGSGVGLYLAGTIARHHGALLTARQRKTSVDGSEWVFRFEMPAYGGTGSRHNKY